MWRIVCLSVVAIMFSAQMGSSQAAGDGPKPTESASARARARQWRVIVLIPEKHLAEIRVPDPAAETAVRKELIDAGYKVIDQERINVLRSDAVIDRILQQGKESKSEVIKLGRRFGADVLVIGEAFTQQEGAARQVVTDLGTVTRLQCRGRLELRAYRTDSAEIFFSDSQHLTGAPDATVELASKTCLTQLGEHIAGPLLKKLSGLSASRTQQIELVVQKIASATAALDLEGMIGRMPGVKDVGPGEYLAHTDTFEITIEKESVLSFLTSLETAPNLKKFHLTIQSRSASRIVLQSK